VNVWFTGDAWDDFVALQRDDWDLFLRLFDLIQAVRHAPFVGIGKPEPLKGDFAGWWSRRINSRHRLVYRVRGRRGEDQQVDIIQCRDHY